MTRRLEEDKKEEGPVDPTTSCTAGKMELLEAEAAERRIRPYLIDANDDDDDPEEGTTSPKLQQQQDDEDDFIMDVVQERLKHHQVGMTPTGSSSQPSAREKKRQGETNSMKKISGQNEANSAKKKISVGILSPLNDKDDGENRNEGGGIPTVPLARQNVSRQSIPGAVAVSGPSPEFDEEEAGSIVTSDSISPSRANDHPVASPPIQNSTNEGDLAVANMVVENDTPNTTNLPHAQDYDAQHQDNIRATKRAKQGKITFLLFAGIVLVVTVIVVLIAVLQRGKSSNTANTEAATTSNTDAPIKVSTTAAPTTSLVESILSLFPATTVARIQDNDQSSQAKAFDWLLLEDGENLASLSPERLRQKFALATLFYSMRGDDWTNNDNWLNHGIHECNWFNYPTFSWTEVAVLYDGFMATYPLPINATCHNSTGMYQHLWLIRNNLVGSIPDEIYLLTGLETISLGWNPQLEGTISTLLGQLSNLRALGLNRVSLSTGATVPKEIGLLTNLHTILMGGSNLQGTLPMEFWGLTTLDTFTLNFNLNLGGTIPPEVANLSNLRWFVVDRSGFGGGVPTQFGLLKSSEYIDLDGNAFNGTMPSEIGLLGKVTTLLMYENRFEGELPTQLGRLTSTKVLSVHDNQLSGSLPSQLALLTNLELSLNFKDNRNLSGGIPTEIGLLTKLTELDLSNNRFTGNIPSQLAQITALGHLNLAGNLFSGTFPLDFATLEHSLYSLELEDNLDFAGTIPSELCSINATCIRSPWFPLCDKADHGLSFDCTNLLCGCGCSCH